MTRPIIAYEAGSLTVLDQTLLPAESCWIDLPSLAAVAEAIRALRVRGAPLIGVTAAYGVCVALRDAANLSAAHAAAPQAFDVLAATRPTAVNLFWAIERMQAALETAPESGWLAHLEREAVAVHEATRAQDAALAEHGLSLLRSAAKVITHCNTGPLATGGLGTALGVLLLAQQRLGGLHVYVDETRPRWQGAHLTTWELAAQQVPHTLIVDGAAAPLLRSGQIHSVWVGADRIAANGDTANKIGTYSLAVNARHHGVPFYVVAPTSTIDPTLPSGAGIPIEERDHDEVARPHGLLIAPEGTPVWNPAFDVTPAALITAIVTEHGVQHGPGYDFRNVES